MGIWLISAVVLQLACAVCAARLKRPTIWLQIILLVPVFGSLAYCAFEIMKIPPAQPPATMPRHPAYEAANGALGSLGYQAVRARTAESRRALAEQCMRVGRHADARLLFESCMLARNAQDPRLIAGLKQATALMGESAGHSR